MKNIILDGAKMTSRRALHDELAEKLSAPDFYGRNLDALYDLLTELGGTEITLENSDAMLEYLGGYAEAALTVFREAAEYNKNLKFQLL